MNISELRAAKAKLSQKMQSILNMTGAEARIVTTVTGGYFATNSRDAAEVIAKATGLQIEKAVIIEEEWKLSIA